MPGFFQGSLPDLHKICINMFCMVSAFVGVRCRAQLQWIARKCFGPCLTRELVVADGSAIDRKIALGRFEFLRCIREIPYLEEQIGSAFVSIHAWVICSAPHDAVLTSLLLSANLTVEYFAALVLVASV